MPIKNSNLRWILLVLTCATIFIITHEVLNNNMNTITKPYKKINFGLINESQKAHDYAKFNETKQAPTHCETSYSKLFGNLEIDEVQRNWSTIEARNQVSMLYNISYTTFSINK